MSFGFSHVLPPLTAFITRISAVEAAHFPFIWLSILLLTALVGWWLGQRRPAADFFGALRLVLAESVRPREWPFYAAFVVALAGYVSLIFYREDFADYDDDLFTCFSLRGRNHSPPIWPDEGRFFPLAHQEFNILRLITRSITGYHVFAVIELVALLTFVFFALRELRAPFRLGAMVLVLITPSFIIPFGGLSYPERNLLLLLAALAFMVQSYDRWKSPLFLIGSLIAVDYALYLKEPMFVAIAAFAGTRLVLGWLQLRSLPAKKRVLELAKTQLLDLGMIALAGVFVSLLAIAFLPHHGSSYANKVRLANDGGVLSSLLAYAKIDLLLFVFVGAFATRLLGLWRSRQPLDPVWDALAVAGLAYASVVLVLRVYSAYYMAPADFIAALYLAWLAARARHRGLVTAIAFVLASQSAMYSYFVLAERKNTLIAKVELADFLRDLRAKGAGQTRLFLPYSIPYRMMGLAAFLDYKGFQVPSDDPASDAAQASVVLRGPQDFPGGHCVDYRPYLCEHVDAPSSGDLVVLLPDDTLPAGTVSALTQHDKLAFVHLPVGVPRVALPFFSLFRADSAYFSTRPLPAEWLELRVFAVP